MRRLAAASPTAATAKANKPSSTIDVATSLMGQWRPKCIAAKGHYSITSGRGEDQRWDGKAKRLGSFEVDYRVVPCRRLHRQVGRLLAPQDAINLARRAAELVPDIRHIGD